MGIGSLVYVVVDKPKPFQRLMTNRHGQKPNGLRWLRGLTNGQCGLPRPLQSIEKVAAPHDGYADDAFGDQRLFW
nr:hypothetical protein CFP56_32918 [Quercus suber]